VTREEFVGTAFRWLAIAVQVSIRRADRTAARIANVFICSWPLLERLREVALAQDETRGPLRNMLQILGGIQAPKFVICWVV